MKFSIGRAELLEVYQMWREDVSNGNQERFGQYFINRYVIVDETYRPWPKCFYEKDPVEAYNLIWLRMGNE